MTEQHPLDEMRTARRRKSNIRFLVSAVLVIGAIAYLLFSSLENQTYYYTVDEANAMYGDLEGREFRIKGDVVPDTHFVREGSLDEHIFTLVADNETIEISYTGALPDTFSNDAEVVALGQLTSPGHFVATEVVAKGPSRYDESAPTGNERPES